jgi:hypothetical protein
VSSKSEAFDPYDGCEVLRAVVERAIEPYRSLPAEDLEDLRDFLIVHTTTHPAIAPVYARVKRRKPRGKSGIAATGTEEDALFRAATNAAGTARGGRS